MATTDIKLNYFMRRSMIYSITPVTAAAGILLVGVYTAAGARYLIRRAAILGTVNYTYTCSHAVSSSRPMRM